MVSAFNLKYLEIIKKLVILVFMMMGTLTFGATSNVTFTENIDMISDNFNSDLIEINHTNEYSWNSPERIIEIDMKLTAENGCEFHVTGTVNVSIGFGGVTINGYDITAEGPCGTFHFVQEVENVVPDNPELKVDEGDLRNIISDIVNKGL